jgi:hypothetical protein
MVLISIHPFAVRKMILLLMALLGFSALCSADPVLMVRRHGQVHSRVAVALPVRTVALQLTDVTAPAFAPNTTAALDKEDVPTLRDSWLCFQPDRCAVEAMGDPASAPFWPTISRD